MTISFFGHRHPLMWVDQSESWFPAKHAHVRRHQTQHILCQQRLSYLRSTSNYFLVVAWFFYFFIEKVDFLSKIQTFWRKRRPYLCVFFKKVLFADQSPLKRTQLVSLLTFPWASKFAFKQYIWGLCCQSTHVQFLNTNSIKINHSRAHYSRF